LPLYIWLSKLLHVGDQAYGSVAPGPAPMTFCHQPSASAADLKQRSPSSLEMENWPYDPVSETFGLPLEPRLVVMMMTPFDAFEP
jgi:hypothetical protein